MRNFLFTLSVYCSNEEGVSLSDTPTILNESFSFPTLSSDTLELAVLTYIQTINGKNCGVFVKRDDVVILNIMELDPDYDEEEDTNANDW